MNEPANAFELLMGALTILFVCVAGGAGAYLSLLSKISDHGERITKVESFIELMGTQAMKSLHRDDDYYGLDKIIDKYTSKNGDLPLDDWLNVKHICENNLEQIRMLEEQKHPSEHFKSTVLPMLVKDKALLVFVKCFAEHKLKPYWGKFAVKDDRK